MLKIIIAIIISYIVGVLTGWFGFARNLVRRTFGTIKSMDSEDGPYLYLDLDQRPEGMADYPYVVFKVGMRKGPPQE